MFEKIKMVQKNMKKSQDRQNKYSDQKRREVNFTVGDMVYLKTVGFKGKGKDRFGKITKLGTRYEGPFLITARIGEVAYRLALPDTMSNHKVFHVSNFRKYIRDPEKVKPPKVEEEQSVIYPDRPLYLAERRIRRLRNKEIPQVQVYWGNNIRK